MGILNLSTYNDINSAVKICRETEGSVLLDVRTKAEYSEGYIEGSINVPLDDLEDVESLVPDKQAKIYVYCRSGKRSAYAAEYLVEIGYENVEDIGGIIAYRGKLTV